jgi:release factor glutamine methyltransferase
MLRAPVQRIRSLPLVVKRLFGAELPPGVEATFDTTTLALRTAIEKWRHGATSALELGVGETALLSIFLARRSDARIDAVDVSSSRVESARRVVAHNRLDIRVWQSDLFSAVDDRYDLIYFNPPYVPTETGRRMDLTRRGGFDDDQVWDGGPDGTGVISQFFAQAPDHLTDDGRLLVGVQDFHVPNERMRALIDDHAFEVEALESPRFIPSTVWVLKAGR